MVFYARMPGNIFQGNWTAGLYLDERANQQQAEALGSIYSGQAGGWPAVLSALIANPLAPKQVPIQFETVDGEHRITVPGLLEVGTEQMPNPLPGQPPLDPKVADLAVPFYTGKARVRRRGFPCCLRFPCEHAAATTPVQRLGLLFALPSQPYQLSPIGVSGRPAHRPFRGLLGVHSRCGLLTRAVTNS